MTRLIFVLGLTSMTLLFSCRHDPDLTNVPDVHFSTEIQAILSGNCTMSGCHDGNGQFSLIGYDNVIANGSVKAYNAHDSKFYEVLKAGGENAMPPASSPSLTSKQIQQIFVWIEQGALNN